MAEGSQHTLKLIDSSRRVSSAVVKEHYPMRRHHIVVDWMAPAVIRDNLESILSLRVTARRPSLMVMIPPGVLLHDSTQTWLIWPEMI